METSRVTKKPWGEFRQFTLNETTTVKTLTVEYGEELSLQTHEHRSEHWHVLEGHPRIVCGDQTLDAQPGEEFFIEQGMKHQLAAPHDRVVVLEIAHGHFDEDDITRLADKYKR